MDEKLKSENMQKQQFSVFMLYFESNQGRQVWRTALWRPHIYSDIFQNAPFQSNFLHLRRQRDIDPPNQSPVDVPEHLHSPRKASHNFPFGFQHQTKNSIYSPLTIQYIQRKH